MLRLPDWYPALIARVLGHAPDHAPSLHRHERLIASLSEYFTDVRPRAHGARTYFRDAASREAYFLYFTTSNLLKPKFPLDELALSLAFTSKEHAEVLDLGCGTGTGLLALAAWREHNARVSGLVPPRFTYTATDRDPAVLAFVQRVHDALVEVCPEHAPELRTMQLDLAAPKDPGRRYDLVLAMNVLNELHVQQDGGALAWIADQLASDGALLVIEPALRDTSRRLLMLRDHAVGAGWTTYAPCFRQGACPALEHDKDWCHQDIAWERPAYIETLDHALGNVKLSLKFSYLILNRHGLTLADAFHDGRTYQRVVSEVFLEKGRTLLYLCGGEGRRLYQRNRRDTTYENAVLDDLRRYDIVAVHGELPREHDVRIDQDTVVLKA